MIEMAIGKITAQQPSDHTAVWMVGEQLKDMCRRSVQDAELLCRDLDVKAMSLVEAEKQIKAFADKHKTGNFACVTPEQSEGILRKFYGLSDGKAHVATPVVAPKQAGHKSMGSFVDLADFL